MGTVASISCHNGTYRNGRSDSEKGEERRMMNRVVAGRATFSTRRFDVHVLSWKKIEDTRSLIFTTRWQHVIYDTKHRAVPFIRQLPSTWRCTKCVWGGCLENYPRTIKQNAWGPLWSSCLRITSLVRIICSVSSPETSPGSIIGRQRRKSSCPYGRSVTKLLRESLKNVRPLGRFSPPFSRTTKELFISSKLRRILVTKDAYLDTLMRLRAAIKQNGPDYSQKVSFWCMTMLVLIQRVLWSGYWTISSGLSFHTRLIPQTWPLPTTISSPASNVTLPGSILRRQTNYKTLLPRSSGIWTHHGMHLR